MLGQANAEKVPENAARLIERFVNMAKEFGLKPVVVVTASEVAGALMDRSMTKGVYRTGFRLDRTTGQAEFWMSLRLHESDQSDPEEYLSFEIVSDKTGPYECRILGDHGSAIQRAVETRSGRVKDPSRMIGDVGPAHGWRMAKTYLEELKAA